MFQTRQISIAFRARGKKNNYPEEIITKIIGKAPRDKNMIKIIRGDLYVNTNTLSIKKKQKDFLSDIISFYSKHYSVDT